MDIGSAVGRKQGVSDRQLSEINVYETSDAFSGLEKLVLRYAALMVQAHVEVPEELIAELRQHLSDQQIVELTSAIAWENYRARFNRALGVEAVGYSEGAVCAVPQRQP
jgi:alkylhydroperoxidase family enzyme